MNKFLMANFVLLLSIPSLISPVFAEDANQPQMQIILDDQPAQSVTSTQSNVVANPTRDILYSVSQNDYTWKNGPASFPRGTSYTVLEGDPFGVGPYTMRIKFPPNYRLPSHAHNDLEEVTVISGVFYIALGDVLKEEEGIKLSAGDFTVLTQGVNHFEWTGSEGAIVQFHGVAPRTALYVNKKDDPTWKKPLISVNTNKVLTDNIKTSIDTAVNMASSKVTHVLKKLPPIVATRKAHTMDAIAKKSQTAVATKKSLVHVAAKKVDHKKVFVSPAITLAAIDATRSAVKDLPKHSLITHRIVATSTTNSSHRSAIKKAIMTTKAKENWSTKTQKAIIATAKVHVAYAKKFMVASTKTHTKTHVINSRKIVTTSQIKSPERIKTSFNTHAKVGVSSAHKIETVATEGIVDLPKVESAYSED